MTKVKHMHDIVIYTKYILALDLNLAKKACPAPKTLAIIIISKIFDVLIKWHEGDHLALNVTFVATSGCRNEKVYLDSHRRHPPLLLSPFPFIIASCFHPSPWLSLLLRDSRSINKNCLNACTNDECLQNDTRLTLANFALLKLGNSRKYPYTTTDGFNILTPPCLRKFQNALPPHALRIP